MRASFALFICLTATPFARAQVNDSTVVAGLSGQTEPPVAFYSDSTGARLAFNRPAERAELDLVSLLQAQPGMMPYSFGTPGWPSSFSPFALNPNETQLTLDSLPFEDLITGRARFDLLPYTLLHEIRTDNSTFGKSFAVHAVSEAYMDSEPVTELRYG